MSVLNVVCHPDAVLRQVAQPVTEITPEILALLDDMVDTMYDEEGIGLAAPQVGVSKRVIVIDVEAKEEGKPLHPVKMINPEIISVSETQTVLEEGCLSLPEMRVEVSRPDKVKFRYTDVHGIVQEVDAEDLLAKCIQHEIDHLDGKLIFDYLSPLKRDMALRRYQKVMRARAED